MQLAANRLHFDIIDWVLENRRSSNFEDRHLVNWNAQSIHSNSTVLGYVADSSSDNPNYESRIKKLILDGADPYRTDRDGDSPLSFMPEDIKRKARQWRENYLNS